MVTPKLIQSPNWKWLTSSFAAISRTNGESKVSHFFQLIEYICVEKSSYVQEVSYLLFLREQFLKLKILNSGTQDVQDKTPEIML